MGAACRRCYDSLLGRSQSRTALLSSPAAEESGTCDKRSDTELSDRQTAAHPSAGPIRRPDFLPEPLSWSAEHGDEVFYSFNNEEAAAIEAISFKRASRRVSVVSEATTIPSQTLRKKVPSSNSNRISQYRWLEELLARVARGEAKEAVFAADSRKPATPLFVVAGACPNGVCGMQAVMYSLLEDSVAFWWVKPQEKDPSALEKNTLNLHTQGGFKNAAGRAKAVYEPLAQKFKGVTDGDFAFGVDRESGRAFIDEMDDRGKRTRMLLYFVWQESWSSMMARKKFIKGKMCYQRSSGDGYYARQYKIQDGQLFILEAETEQAMDSLLPPNEFQVLYEMSD